jgi:hypothetical protein
MQIRPWTYSDGNNFSFVKSEINFSFLPLNIAWGIFRIGDFARLIYYAETRLRDLNFFSAERPQLRLMMAAKGSTLTDALKRRADIVGEEELPAQSARVEQGDVVATHVIDVDVVHVRR